MHALETFQNEDEKLKQHFIKLSSDLVAVLANEGVHTKAYRDGLPHFSVLSSEKKNYVLKHLDNYYQLCAEHLGEGQPLRDSKKFTWRALVKMNMTPRSDLLNSITEGDIVEIYNTEHIQLFRNLEFFDVCSYTLEELFCVEWYRLFEREKRISDIVTQVVEDIYSQKYPEGILNPVPKHIVNEIFSSENFQATVLMKFMAPLYQNKRVSGIVCIEQGHINKAPKASLN